MIRSERLLEQDAGGDESATAAAATTELDGAACWRLLGREGLGRLAVTTEDGVDIFPVNYLSSQARLYFRSAPGTKVVNVTRHPRIAFEVDGRTMLARWSVVVRGLVHRLASDPEILRSGVQSLHAWEPGGKFNYFEIVPEQISGRFIRPRG
jgi:nitroimidazol reductase NimA-like FMN-containing flavoprotein (pyridoxamine 5'-phosphate oxidase superfamily)